MAGFGWILGGTIEDEPEYRNGMGLTILMTDGVFTVENIGSTGMSFIEKLGFLERAKIFLTQERSLKEKNNENSNSSIDSSVSGRS